MKTCRQFVALSLIFGSAVCAPSIMAAEPDWQAPRTAEGRMYEYACHEGNYALPGILAGARVQERSQ